MTFDDGPDPRYTPKVLAHLADLRASATFFVLLTRVRRYQALLQELVAAGHEVGLHGPDHRRLTTLPAKEVLTRTRQARLALEDMTGETVRWFRPPYGAQTLATYLATRRAGLDVVLWGPSLWDWKDAPNEERLSRSTHGLRAGAIVLGHDGLADAEDGEINPVSPTLNRAQWAAEVLSNYAELGFRAVSLRDLMAEGHLVRRGYFSIKD
jgi:peptidoglycan/xylan/chitin deacetylase (PgdA/CDA1 family)